MSDFNRDVKTRDAMIFGEYHRSMYSGGIREFTGISLDLLEKLLEMGFIEPDETQNYSPTVQEFIEFAKKWGGYTFDGYTVAPERVDYRVTITAISKVEPTTDDEVIAFAKAFRNADELELEAGLYAWWD